MSWLMDLSADRCQLRPSPSASVISLTRDPDPHQSVIPILYVRTLAPHRIIDVAPSFSAHSFSCPPVSCQPMYATCLLACRAISLSLFCSTAAATTASRQSRARGSRLLTSPHAVSILFAALSQCDSVFVPGKSNLDEPRVPAGPDLFFVLFFMLNPMAQKPRSWGGGGGGGYIGSGGTSMSRGPRATVPCPVVLYLRTS